jgi:hypothetical protein
VAGRIYGARRPGATGARRRPTTPGARAIARTPREHGPVERTRKSHHEAHEGHEEAGGVTPLQ